MTLPREGKGIQNDQFAGKRVMPGDILQTDLKVSETFTHQPARIPVTVIRGERPGPTLFVTAAVHGDEINGVAIVRRLLDVLDPDMISGTLIGVPVVNRFGFLSQDRYLPDRRDLNRHFPGDRNGSMASRIAHQLFRHVVRISDAGVDLHTAAGGQSNLCHIRGDASDPEARELMRAFGTPIMMDHPGPVGSLRRAATEAAVPTVIFEAGEPSRFQHHVVEIGYKGVLRIMKHMGMIERRFRRPEVHVLVKKTEWVRSDHGGILDLSVEPGDLVRNGQVIGTIHDPFGRHVDELTASHSGVVLSTATVPLTNPGNAVVHIGHLHKSFGKAQEYVKAGGDMGHVHWVAARRRFAKKKAAAETTAKPAVKATKKPAASKTPAKAKPAVTAKAATKTKKAATSMAATRTKKAATAKAAAKTKKAATAKAAARTKKAAATKTTPQAKDAKTTKTAAGKKTKTTKSAKGGKA